MRGMEFETLLVQNVFEILECGAHCSVLFIITSFHRQIWRPDQPMSLIV